MIENEFLQLLEEAGFDTPKQPIQPLTDDSLRQQLLESLEKPVGYPPLREYCVVGDRIVLAIGAAIPQIGLVVQGILEHLRATRAEPIDCQLLVTPAVARVLKASDLTSHELHVHDATDEQSLAFLSVGCEDQAIYVNRLLFDADCVIPIHLAAISNQQQQSDPLFPTFSGVANRDQFETMSTKHRQSDVTQVNNQLGSFFCIELAAGAGQRILSIASGDRGQVHQATQESLRRYWNVKSRNMADCVVATIETQADETTWSDVFQALLVCDRFVTSHAPIMLWTELQQLPNKSVRSSLLKSFKKSADSSQQDLIELEAVIENHPIFLRSRLPTALIEDLGIGSLETPEQMLRISGKHAKKLLLRDAHRWQLTAKPQPIAKRGRRR